MIDQGLLLDFRTPSTYINGIIAARIRLCANNGTCWVLKDRMAKSMTKYAVAIFDETGKSELDVLLMGNTLYVLGVRLAEDKWFISKNQPKEFGGSMSHVAKTMEFQCGYGELGVTPGSNTEVFRVQDCSRHVASLKTYVLAGAGVPSDEIIRRAKVAFAYFAMMIGEAIRFRSVAARAERGALAPSAELAQLQRWVIDSSVRDVNFPETIAVAGIHEKTSSELFKRAMTELLAPPGISNRPTLDDLSAGGDPPSRATIQRLLNGEGIFASDAVKHAALVAIFSAYFKNRISGTELQKGRQFLDGVEKKYAVRKQGPSPNDFAGIDRAID